MIGNLQSLRFIFAIMIFLHHYPVNGVGLFEAGGSCGVSFFLVLSGFVMAFGYYDKVQQSAFHFKDYIAKRLVRIYPVHILCLLLFILLNVGRFFDDSNLLVKLIPNALLLQSWTSDYFSGNAVSWCLCDMLFFYLLFPYIVRVLAQLKPKHIAGLVVLVAVIYAAILKYLPSEYDHRVLYITPLLRLIDFGLGIGVYRLYRYLISNSIGEKIHNLSFATKTTIEVLLIVVLTVQIYLFPLVPTQFICASYWWFIMATLILVFALFDNYRGGISLVLSCKSMRFLGEFSFTLYMVHVLVIQFLRPLFHQLPMHLPGYITLILIFVITLGVGYIVYRYYEQPIAKTLLKRI